LLNRITNFDLEDKTLGKQIRKLLQIPTCHHVDGSFFDSQAALTLLA
jgi:hypothetical protein